MRNMIGDITEENNQAYFNMGKGPLDI